MNASVNAMFDDRRPADGFEIYGTNNGRFKTLVQFDTFKSYNSFTGHDCTATPSRVFVFVNASGYRAKRFSFDLISAAKGRNENDIYLPRIKLARAK